MTKILCRFAKTLNNVRRISDSFCIYSSDDFANMPPEVAKVNRSGLAVVKVVGKNLPRLADWTISFEGEWKYSKKFGWTFFADRYDLIEPSTLTGIVRYLSSKAFPGIGEKTATAIVKEFKEQTLEVIEKTPELLLRIKGINIDRCGTIKEAYQRNVAYSKLGAYLAAYSISNSVASNIYESGKTIEDIKANPYVLLEVKSVGFQTCEKIARAEKVALDSYVRIDGAAKSVLTSDSERCGNLFMVYDDFENKTLSLLNEGIDPAPVSLERFRDYIKAAVKGKKIVFRGGKYIFLKEYDDAEQFTAEKIGKMLDPKNSLGLSVKTVSSYLEDYCNSSAIHFTENQKNAVIRSLMTRLSIITGGPGTGKTTILNAVISVFKRLHPSDDVTLLAPTGKAARRMTEATGHDAYTVHSKLQIYDDALKAASTVIEPGLIVVDEASMLDALVMDKLLRAISSKCNQIIFIGDINQLPSVGPGLVLKEMIASEAIPVSRLTEVFRQKGKGASIIENAEKVNHNQTDLVYDSNFQLVTVKNEEDALVKIEQIYADETKKLGIDNVALLSPLRRTQNRFMVVSDGLNAYLQKQIVPANNMSVTFNGTEFRAGDRVMQWRNTKESSNGDIGVVSDIIQTDDGVFVKIKWENGNETEEIRETMSHITLAYSISIHKSQGSEYDCVIIPLLSDQICKGFMSALLYTGLTRAKQRVYLVTDEGNKALNYCIMNNSQTRRNTLLSARIRALKAVA